MKTLPVQSLSAGAALLLLSGCVTSPPTFIAAWTDTNGIAGFDKLHWGMTAKEIQQVYPNFAENRDPRTQVANGLRMPNFDWAGCQFRVTLGFFNRYSDVLTTISYYSTGGNVSVCGPQIKSMLMQQYGNAITKPGVMLLKTEKMTDTDWSGPVLSVTFREYDFSNGTTTWEIDYTHTHASGTYID